jgi:hypothetical protein
MSNQPPARTEREDQRTGFAVFLALAVLTVLEFAIAVSLDSLALLVLLLAVAAVGKCWAIAVYFMHVSRLWRGEEAR